MTSFETNNRYDIKNNLDQMVYIVTEDTDDFTRNAYRTLRPFVLRVTDCMGREIMTMQRPFRCTCCCLCCPSARQEVRECRSYPWFLPDPSLPSILVLLPEWHRRGLSLALMFRMKEESGGGGKPHCLMQGKTQRAFSCGFLPSSASWGVKHKLGLFIQWP